MKEQFLTQMAELYDDMARQAPGQLWQLAHRIRDLLNLQNEDTWQVIETKLKGMEIFREISRAEKLSAYKVYARVGWSGPSIHIELKDGSPVKVTLTLIDSYYEPRAIYDEDTGPRYVNWDDLREAYPEFEASSEEAQASMMEDHSHDNGDWEPSAIRTISEEFLEPDDVWPWIEEQAKVLLAKWEALPPFEL